MSGDFNLLKYFKSFCGIKSNAATDRNQKQCSPFDDFQFVIYTNQELKSKSPTQASESPPHVVDSEPLSILISGTDYGKYITFDETHDTDIFGFFEELSNIINLLNNWTGQLKFRTSVDKAINETIKKLHDTLDILQTLNYDIVQYLNNQVTLVRKLTLAAGVQTPSRI
jgi:hypothetical protein